jgi:prepilin-type N-terminal cleavage/methylation domain-containing protein
MKHVGTVKHPGIVKRLDDAGGEAGFTLIELMVAISIFLVIMATICGSLFVVESETNSNLTTESLTQSGMLALNQVANEIRDMSNSYDNSVQSQDNGAADIQTMSATEIKFLSGNNIINNESAGLVDSSGGTFTTGCANEIDIKLVSGNLVQTETTPTLVSGQCTWSGTAGSETVAQDVMPLCSGSACASTTSTGAAIFSYQERYPDEADTASTSAQVGEVTIGFAVLPAKTSSYVAPVVLTQTVRLGAVVNDPSAS